MVGVSLGLKDKGLLGELVSVPLALFWRKLQLVVGWPLDLHSP